MLCGIVCFEATLPGFSLWGIFIKTNILTCMRVMWTYTRVLPLHTEASMSHLVRVCRWRDMLSEPRPVMKKAKAPAAAPRARTATCPAPKAPTAAPPTGAAAEGDVAQAGGSSPGRAPAGPSRRARAEDARVRHVSDQACGRQDDATADRTCPTRSPPRTPSRPSPGAPAHAPQPLCRALSDGELIVHCSRGGSPVDVSAEAALAFA